MGMPATYCRADLVGARMVLGIEQRLNDREPLRRYGNPAFSAPRNELAESLNRILLTRSSIHQPDFWHKTTPVRPTPLRRPKTSAREKGRMTADRLDNR